MSDDGDIRYRPDIQGYPQHVRKRIRDTEHQVNLLVTARIRDVTTAADEQDPATISHRVREIVHVTRLLREHQALPADVRAAWVSLAATATICAEAADRPRKMGGNAIQAGLRPVRPINVVQLRPATKPRPTRRKDKTVPGQISLWDAA